MRDSISVRRAWFWKAPPYRLVPSGQGLNPAPPDRVPPLGTLHEKVDTSGKKLNRQDAKFAKKAQDEGSEIRFHASVSRFSFDWLGALGVLAVNLDLHPGFSDESSLMVEP
jgi:hypothetical protein